MQVDRQIMEVLRGIPEDTIDDLVSDCILIIRTLSDVEVVCTLHNKPVTNGDACPDCLSEIEAMINPCDGYIEL